MALRAIEACGIGRLWRWRRRHCLPILSLHGVMAAADGGAWRPLRQRLEPQRLEAYLRVLTRAYTFIPLSRALAGLRGEAPLPPYSIVLTFDDGYRNNMTHALPVLRRFGIVPAIFLPTAHIDSGAPFLFDRLDYALGRLREELAVEACGRVWEFPLERAARARVFSALRDEMKRHRYEDNEYRAALTGIVERCEQAAGAALRDVPPPDNWTALLTWDEARPLARAGAVEFGSHTVHHARLARLDPRAARDELRESRRRIEQELGQPCLTLSYPNGSYDAQVARMTEEEGYAAALTTRKDINRLGDDVFALQRIPIPHNLTPRNLLIRASGLSAAWRRRFRRKRPAPA